MTTVAKTLITPDELALMPEGELCELVDGALVEKSMGSEPSAIAMAIGAALHRHIRKHGLGHVFTTDCGYQCFKDDPRKVRKPDISFVRKGRLPNDRPPDGFIKLAPDLAVEVLSPNDLAYEVDEKVAEYLAAGVKLVSVVNPKTKTVRIHRPADSALGRISELAISQTLSGEDVLNDFTCAIAEIFEI